MHDFRSRVFVLLKRWFEYIWSYMGTLSAMVLLLGVLGMGIYHVMQRDVDDVNVRCYTGLYNTAGPELPTGLDEIMPTEQGVNSAHIRFEYDKKGRLLRLVHLNRHGQLSSLPGSSVAEQRMVYDDQGRVIARRNYGVRGEPVSDASGISAREFEYDGDGRLIARIFRDTHGRKIVPRMPGYAEERIAYDAKGRPLSIRFLDGEGNAVVNARGESEVTFAYDDVHHETVKTNSVNGTTANNNEGFAVQVTRSTNDGLTSQTMWRDAAGAAVSHGDGGAWSVLEESRPSELIRRIRYCGKDGVMVDSARVWSEHLIRSTPQGKVEWECYNGSDGLPCLNHVCGYAERVCEYGSDGQLESEYFWDALGNPSECYAKHHTTTDGRHHVISLLSDGATELRLLPSDDKR